MYHWIPGTLKEPGPEKTLSKHLFNKLLEIHTHILYYCGHLCCFYFKIMIKEEQCMNILMHEPLFISLIISQLRLLEVSQSVNVTEAVATHCPAAHQKKIPVTRHALNTVKVHTFLHPQNMYIIGKLFFPFKSINFNHTSKGWDRISVVSSFWPYSQCGK